MFCVETFPTITFITIFVRFYSVKFIVNFHPTKSDPLGSNRPDFSTTLTQHLQRLTNQIHQPLCLVICMAYRLCYFEL